MALDISFDQFNSIASGTYNAGQIDYDIGHRAARGAESRLINSFNFLLTCVEHYNKTYRSEFIHEPGQKDKKEVAA